MTHTATSAEASPSGPEVDPDIIVVGAGHNGLVCASYLAAAGLKVLVLEARDIPGGNTVTEELTLPGFEHDTCSSAHVLIQSNPLLSDDELGLMSTYGLEYIRTDPAVVMPTADGDSFVMPSSVEGTRDEIGRFSGSDADAFTELMREWASYAPLHGRWSSGLPLGDGAAADGYSGLRAQSAWDVIHQRFTHPQVRSFLLWMAMATIQDLRRPGTGFLAASLVAGRTRFGWTTPVGGSGALPQALISQLRAHGGDVVVSATVNRVEVEGGRARSVRTTDGRRFRARRGVVSAAHLVSLAEMLGDDLPPDLAAARDSWQPGLSVFAIHAVLRGDLGYPTTDGAIASTAGGLGSTAGIDNQLDKFWRGELETEDPWLLVVNQTVVDKTRAPDGGATFKILTIAPWDRADGRAWEESKLEFGETLMELVRARVSGLEPDDILAVRYESPRDVASQNIHCLGGSCHGGEFVTPDGEIVPGVTSYLTGIDGLYLTGATTHPGGSVSGRPGRNTARAVLTDLGMDSLLVMGDR